MYPDYKNYYRLGKYAALRKLSTAPGTITYAARPEDEKNTLAENNAQLIWLQNNRSTVDATTKQADLNSGGFSQFSNGLYGSGGLDGNRPKPDRNLRRSIDIQNAFDANEAYDQSYGPESAMTQPHGSKAASLKDILDYRRKTAASSSTFGVGSALKPTTVAPGTKSLNPTANKPKSVEPINRQAGLANNAFGADIANSQGSAMRRYPGSPF